jgi:L-amino acid N-acyltransferase YncA
MYADELHCVSKYEALLRRAHTQHPALAGARLFAFHRAIAVENPSRRFCTWRNVLIMRAGVPHAHACIAFDSRAEDVAHVGFVDIEGGESVEMEIFDAIESIAREQGAHVLRGPINFNTWQDFRCVARDSDAPPFFLEPYTSMKNVLWRAHGFIPKVSYISTAQSVACTPFENTRVRGVTIERLTPQSAPFAIEGLHRVARGAFQNTWGFVPISLEEFAYLYNPVLTQSHTYLILVARGEGGDIVGFLVGAPDLYHVGKKTLVLKSVAVEIGHRARGIGAALFSSIHVYAREHGFERYIFSTMQEENRSIRHLVGDGEFIRAYEVGEKNI